MIAKTDKVSEQTFILKGLLRKYERTLNATRDELRQLKVEIGLALLPVLRHYQETHPVGRAAETTFHEYCARVGIHKARARACLAAAKWHLDGRKGPIRDRGAIRLNKSFMCEPRTCEESHGIGTTAFTSNGTQRAVGPVELPLPRAPDYDADDCEDPNYDGDEDDDWADQDAMEEDWEPELTEEEMTPEQLAEYREMERRDREQSAAKAAAKPADRPIGATGAQMGFEDIYAHFDLIRDRLAQMKAHVSLASDGPLAIREMLSRIDSVLDEYQANLAKV